MYKLKWFLWWGSSVLLVLLDDIRGKVSVVFVRWLVVDFAAENAHTFYGSNLSETMCFSPTLFDYS